MKKFILISFCLVMLVACNTLQTTEDGRFAHASGNFERSVDYWRRSAADGDSWAQYYLGRAYFKGEGVPQNYVKSRHWYQKSVDQGNLNAFNNLGVLYHKGLGVEQNRHTSLGYYIRAAHSGNKTAMKNIGDYYRRGFNVLKVDYVRAYFWYTLAIRHGEEKAVQGRDTFEYLLTEEQIIDIKARVKKIVITDPHIEPFLTIIKLENTRTAMGKIGK